MKLRKNWFYFFIVSLAIMGMFYIFIYSFVFLAKISRNGYFMQGGLSLVLLGIWLLLHIMAATSQRFKLEEKLSLEKAWVRWTEAAIVLSVLIPAAGIRVWLAGQMPEVYLQEHKDYYDIARILFQDVSSFGSRYRDLIADTPGVMGYSYLLMKAFQLWGESIWAGRYLNVFFSVGSAFIAFKIARKAGGRAAGITALLLCAFWPSRILSVSSLSAENAFLFLALLDLWLFLSLIMDYDEETPDGMQAVLLHLVLGVLLAVTAAVSSLCVLLLLAMLIFLFPRRMKLPARPLNDIPLVVRALRRGSIRCILILIPYMIGTGVISSNIELTIDRDIAFTKIAFGSSLWEEINENFIEEKDSKKPKFFAERYIKLIDNDDYRIESCRELLETQESFTREQRDWFDRISAINQAVYAAAAFLSLLCLFFLLNREASPVFLLALLCLTFEITGFMAGTEREFQFLLSEIFILLGATAVGYTFRDGCRKALRVQADKEQQLMETQMDEAELRRIEQKEETLAELRKEAYANVFDMKKALQEGHVIMTVSEAYGKEEESSRVQKWEEPQEDDFDWNFTEEELNGLIEQDWAAVKESVDKKIKEVKD